MKADGEFDEINEAKASMDHIYDQPDPRAYFSELRKLHYNIPGAAKPIFETLISRLRRRRDEQVRVLDLGCSYGVNAALLKHDLTMPDLYDHWGQQRFEHASPDEVVEYDKRFFGNLAEDEDLEVIGLDQAESALEFAEDVGLLDESLAVNLETEPLPDSAKQDLAAVDLIVSTGCVGYVTEKPFERLLPAVSSGSLPWLANFVLRMFPFDAIEAAVAEQGYVTEKLEGRTFRQRRFASDGERQQVLGQLRDQGLDPAKKEADGYLHAEFYLSRPKAEAARMPIDQLLVV